MIKGEIGAGSSGGLFNWHVTSCPD
jgi:hypothetical protein